MFIIKNKLVFLMILQMNFINSNSLDVYMQDFKTCMNNPEGIKYKKKFDWGSDFNRNAIKHLEDLYNKNHFSKIERSDIPKIPKIIHQIWIGPKPLPEICKKLGNNWKKFHPAWEYKLWTNETIQEILSQMPLEHRELYDQADDWRGKADILRYHILYLHGGLYVDMDSLCLASFDELHHYYDFYTGISHNNGWREEILNNATIACSPGHPIMRYVLDNIKKDSAGHWIKIYGVLYFSNIVLDVLFSASGVNIALPSNIFYPEQRRKGFSIGMLKNSMCMHYWASGSNPHWEIDTW